MIVVVDFCKTLVSFNTTQTFIKIFLGNGLFYLLKLFLFSLSKFKIYVSEVKLLIIFRKFNSKRFEKSIQKLNLSINNNLNKNLIKKLEYYKINNHKLVLNTATFGIFLKKNAFINSLFDYIISSDIELSHINYKEEKLKYLNLLVEKKTLSENFIFYSDSIIDDYPLFLFSDKAFLVSDLKIKRIK